MEIDLGETKKNMKYLEDSEIGKGIALTVIR